MKTLIKYIIVGTVLIGTVGCVCSQKLPSVTLGGAANHKALLGVELDKTGLGVTAPLVDIDVPFPSASKK